MLEDGKISNRQAVILVVTTISPTAILFLPTIIYNIQGSQAGQLVIGNSGCSNRHCYGIYYNKSGTYV
jgi:hypothetical protein